MKKMVGRGRFLPVVLTIAAVLFVLFIILPLTLSLFSPGSYGNVALIPIEGVITSDGSNYFGQATISSQDIVQFIEDADSNEDIKVILLELNSPGGTPVGTDEIASAVLAAEKPVVAVIREVAASGGYWVASAADHVIANRMSMTGSIGVFSGYLEFSGLMEKYGIGYERLIAGENKDIGTPFRKLTDKEKKILQKQLDQLHDFFIMEVAANRDIPKTKVKALATGDVFLGIEALELGLVDQLGNKNTAIEYIKTTYGLEEVTFVPYVKEVGFFDLLTSVTTQFSFHVGEGLGSILFLQQPKVMLQ